MAYQEQSRKRNSVTAMDDDILELTARYMRIIQHNKKDLQNKKKVIHTIEQKNIELQRRNEELQQRIIELEKQHKQSTTTDRNLAEMAHQSSLTTNDAETESTDIFGIVQNVMNQDNCSKNVIEHLSLPHLRIVDTYRKHFEEKIKQEIEQNASVVTNICEQFMQRMGNGEQISISNGRVILSENSTDEDVIEASILAAYSPDLENGQKIKEFIWKGMQPFVHKEIKLLESESVLSQNIKTRMIQQCRDIEVYPAIDEKLRAILKQRDDKECIEHNMMNEYQEDSMEDHKSSYEDRQKESKSLRRIGSIQHNQITDGDSDSNYNSVNNINITNHPTVNIVTASSTSTDNDDMDIID